MIAAPFAAMMVRDIYQDRWRPQAGNRELIYASYASTLLVLVLAWRAAAPTAAPSGPEA